MVLGSGIEVLPDESRLMIGGDNWHAEETFATLNFARRLIADVLTEKVADDYIRSRLYDNYAGDHREHDDPGYRLIEMDRSHRWDVRRIRGGRPDVPRYWD